MQTNNLNNINLSTKTKNNYVKVHNSQESISNDNAFMLNNVSFGMNNPQLALLRAQKLKAEYAKAGIKYLLPNEVWSTKKIMQTIDKATEHYDSLLERGKKITITVLNKIISKILPKQYAKEIKIKDYVKEFPKHLKLNGYSKEQINRYIRNFSGMLVSEEKESVIYINLRDNNYHGKIFTESTFLHELKHAITSRTTNINKNEAYSLKNLRKISNIFNEIESSFEIKPDVHCKQVDITEENLYKNLINIKSGKSLNTKKDFKLEFFNELEKILRKNPDINEYDLLKHFKTHIKDEQEAYTTRKILRKINGINSKPLGNELLLLMYKEFGKFISEAKKHYEKTQAK